MNEQIVILDFGSQYTQVIARRIRECQVFSQIRRYDTPASEIKASGIILSGGPASVYAEGAPRLDPALLTAGIPVFGICYGNQIMAHALGGSVERAAQSEIGWYEVDTDVPDVIAPGPWFEWHNDVVRVPAGAHELARTSSGPQAWQMGSSFCTQFHPEVNEAVVRRWVEGGGEAEARAFGRDPLQMIDDTRRNVAISRPNADRIVDWFVESVVR